MNVKKIPLKLVPVQKGHIQILPDSPEGMGERELLTMFYNCKNDDRFSHAREKSHPNTSIELNGQKGQIDNGLLGVFEYLWSNDFITVGSCEGDPKPPSWKEGDPQGDNAYIGFYKPHALKFSALLTLLGICHVVDPFPIKGTYEGNAVIFRGANIRFLQEAIPTINTYFAIFPK
jgi:hypothetical protein